MRDFRTRQISNPRNRTGRLTSKIQEAAPAATVKPSRGRGEQEPARLVIRERIRMSLRRHDFMESFTSKTAARRSAWVVMTRVSPERVRKESDPARSVTKIILIPRAFRLPRITGKPISRIRPTARSATGRISRAGGIRFPAAIVTPSRTSNRGDFLNNMERRLIRSTIRRTRANPLPPAVDVTTRTAI